MATYRFEKLSPRILLHADELLSAADTSVASDTSQEPAHTSTASTTYADGHLAVSVHEYDGHDDGTHHPDDPVRGGEHQALLDLVPHEQVTHRAITDGPWSEASTWQDGLLPGELAHVLIPHDVAVEVDGEFDARLATIRVDGLLTFATDVDTSLTVDTFVVAVNGTLHIGTSERPIAPDVLATILFTDDGPIDTVWDPTVLSRGLISHGNVSIHGATKSGPIDFATAPAAGATELELNEPATGWQVGDRVLVPGVVRPIENNRGVTQRDEDEIVTITAISPDGTVLEIDQPLQFDHLPPRAQLKIPAANLDRNVKFTSENQTDPQRAGHVMFMHSPNATVNYASFNHIGRNDKSIATTDPDLDDNGVLIPGTGDNARGRYAVHFHRIGSETEAATVAGSVVENNPGWGFVNHDSNVVFRENTSYNVKGAGFVTEIGSERGAFISNLAVRSTGKNFYQPTGASDKGAGAGFGSAGHGFWLQSASVALVDNVAAGHAQEGIFIHSRTVTEFNRDLPTYASLVDTPVGTPLDFSANAAEPAIRDDQIRIDQAAMAEMSGNQVFASGAGLGVRWRRQSAAVSEGTNGDVFENFAIWNVEWSGIHLGYVSGLTLTDGLILGDVNDPLALNSNEQNNRSEEPSEFHTSLGKGIAANRNSKNLVFQNLEIAGFTVGIQALTQSHTRIDTVLLQNIEDLVIVTPQATSQSDDMRRIDATNVFHLPLSEAALGGADPYKVRLLKQIVRVPVAGGSSASQEWSAFTANDEIYYNGHRLYFRDQAGNAVPFPTSDAPSFMDGTQYNQYLDRTNEQLQDEFGLALGGAVAPAEAFDAGETLGIDGLAVQLDEPVELPPRVEFGFDEDQNPTPWTMSADDLQVTWRSKALSLDTQWRVYLAGENGIQEIGRTGVAAQYGHIVAGDEVADWQTWNFNWPLVGELPPQWSGTVETGEHSLIAVADGSPAVYLGRVSIIDAAGDTNSTTLAAAAEQALDDSELPPDENELLIDLVAMPDDSSQTPNGIAIDAVHTQRAQVRTQPLSVGRAGYRPAARLELEPLDDVFAEIDS